MERIFRSRGIRILYNDGHTLCKEKVYYEPDESCVQKNEYIENLQERGLISLFEYSVVEEQIDTYNFHVSLTNENYMEIYEGISSNVVNAFEIIKMCFGGCMKNYTIGYKMRGAIIEQQSFYFYPTIWKGTRYGIKGITEQGVINDGISKFAELIARNYTSTSNEINNFSEIIYKFKGISIHPYGNSIGYKIYGRVDNNIIKKYLMEKYGFNMESYHKYGECVLAALRIINGQVQGINIYFLR